MAAMHKMVEMEMQEPIRKITAEEVETYKRDGVVCLRGLLPAEWTAELIKVMDKIESDHDVKRKNAEFSLEESTDQDHSQLHAMNNLGDLIEQAGGAVLKENSEQKGSGEFILVNNATRDYEGVRRVALESPLAEAAGALFGSNKINFLFDQIFIKQAGASTRTAFHQDQGYFRVDGTQCATFWTACERVDLQNGAMGYVKGSHHWETYAPNSFVSQLTMDTHGLPQLPDIEGNEDDYDIVYYEVEPGDVIVHDYRTVHGARGNVSTNRGRRSAAIRFAGDDVTYLNRPSAPTEFPIDETLKDGDPLDGNVFPVVWQRR